MTDDRTLWAEALAECDTLEKFNYLPLALARERRESEPEFAKFVATEAKRRGYRYEGDKETGQYIELTEAEHKAVFAELEKRDRRKCTKRLAKSAKFCKVSSVKVAWEQWAYRSGKEDVGALIIMDFRKHSHHKKTGGIIEIDEVPKDLYLKLFQDDAARTLAQILTIYGGQPHGEIRDWRSAF